MSSRQTRSLVVVAIFTHTAGYLFTGKCLSLEDHLGRSWQCGTIQVDFNLPQIFDLSFVNSDGSFEQPVILHQAVLGSIERWIGILLENHGGALPLWLAPVQIAVASISDKSVEWAKAVVAKLRRIGVRTELINRDATISKKIHELSKRKIPLIAVVGEREAANGTVNLRRFGVSGQEEIAFALLEEEFSGNTKLRSNKVIREGRV
ncbi:MAG: hypothetical protein KME30_29015 [Iphinoe sp. HA4291-MV1]|nr:hypothetical protein [Iphinoe sp. HA4291-MV1]